MAKTSYILMVESSISLHEKFKQGFKQW